MEGQTVLYEIKGNIGFITLNRPEKLNAQNALMAQELLSTFRQIEGDPEVRVIVLNGAGRAFCSGHDLSEAKSGVSLEEHIADVEVLQEITATIMKMGKPVIAAVHGYALGAGCEWAMNCDMIIAAEDAKFGFPETSLGSAVSNGGTKILPILIGLLRAKEMILSNRIIDAEKAEDWGLVNRVVPLNRMIDEATSVARKMAENPALANRLAKSAINQAIHLDIEQTLRTELKDMVITSLTGEFDVKGNKTLKKFEPNNLMNRNTED
jgi:enoyl-CoA hydratase/carnithine racemase